MVSAGQVLGGSFVCHSVSQMVGRGSSGGVLFLVCLGWKRLLVRIVSEFIGSVVIVCVVTLRSEASDPTLASCLVSCCFCSLLKMKVSVAIALL